MTATLKRNRANHDFSRNPKIHVPRSVFRRPWRRLMTLDCSYLYPICIKLVNPGETWKLDLDLFARLATQTVPVMDNLRIQTFFFFDPCRLLWKNFTKMHGERENPDDTIDYIAPKIQLNKEDLYFGTLYDYMRAPMDVNKKIVSMPFRMYNHIWNSYFRNQHLQDSLPFNTDDEDDNVEDFKLVRINKRADYITTALPSLQMGEPVQLPLGTTAPVIGTGNVLGLTNGQYEGSLKTYAGADYINSSQLTNIPVNNSDAASGGRLHGTLGVSQNPENSGLVALLNEAAGASIQSLRHLIATEDLLERDNRTGTRYTEQLAGRYGVSNPDLLLYRPQYLGGTSELLGTTPVIQTSGTNEISPQGNLAGYGVTSDSGRVIEASFGEWGYIMGLVAISSEPQYQYGCDKLYTMDERYKYYYPEFNHIGDETLTNGQVFCQGDDVTDNEGNIIDDMPFAYTERNAYYKQNMNEICGKLRSNSKHKEILDGQETIVNDSLENYHYAEEWTEKPEFSDDFITDKTFETVQRSIAVPSEPQVIMEVDFDALVYSPMPEYNLPKIEAIV